MAGKAGRPRLGEGPLVKVSLLLPPEVIARIDAVCAHEQARLTTGRVERSSIYRDALLRGLAAIEEGVKAAREAAASPFHTTGVDLGACLIDIDDVSAALATAEGEDYR